MFYPYSKTITTYPTKAVAYCGGKFIKNTWIDFEVLTFL